MKLASTIAAIRPVCRQLVERAQAQLDRKTKPPGSLGRLETLACQLASIHGGVVPPMTDKAIVVMGADHGVVAEGVSAYPQAVTAQMLGNMLSGGAAINVLARQAGARLVLVDMGVCEPPAPSADLRSHRIGPGTRNFTRGPAMARAQALQAIEVGIALAEELAERGVGLIGLGEMGIGNTTASSAVTCALTGKDPASVTGRGTGVDDLALARKLRAIERGLAVNHPDPQDAVDVLAKVGGFELSGLCGVVLGAARAGVPVVLDGFIASTSALCAVRLAPTAADYLIASHRSVEAGHGHVLTELAQVPLLDLGLRLGEGTGAALAMMLVEAAIRIANEMATFESAAVSGPGDDL